MKRFLHGIVRISIGNGFKLLSSLVLAFLVPAFFSVENYGYYRIFILYTTYISLLHFGFNDGIYITLGGKNYNSLDKNNTSKLTWFLVGFQFIISIVLIVISLFLFSGTRQITMIMIGINVLSINLTGYFMLISQATSRFKEYSNRNIIQALLTIFSVFMMFVFKIDNALILIFIITVINHILCLWYIWTYRDIVFPIKRLNFKFIKEGFVYVLIGIPLLLSNFTATLIINLSKQFVDIIYDIETFAIFSFAYSLMSFTSIFIAAIGTVIYPSLRKIKEEKYSDIYMNSSSILIIVSILMLSLFYPISYIVITYLPKYTDSLDILRIIMPSLIFITPLQIIKHNLFKVLFKSIEFLKASAIALLFSIAITILFYLIFRTIMIIAISSIISLFIWYVITDIYLQKLVKIDIIKQYLLISFGLLLFYVITSQKINIFMMLIYLFVVLLVTFIEAKKSIQSLIKINK